MATQQSQEEQRIIDGLFSRLKEAEDKTGERDENAEARIREHVSNQPSAPYYMAQTILIQEAALKQLNARVEELERKQTESGDNRSSGGFLAGIFGAGERKPTTQPSSQNRRANYSASQPGWGSRSAQPGSYGASQGGMGMASRGGGFLGGALQTAAGVAGGLVLGNMLMDMFSDHQPEEMASAIEDNPADTAAADQQDIDNTSADAEAGPDNGYDQSADYADSGYSEDDFYGGDFRDGGDFDDGGGFDEV
ncbi:DUF2076 domain-containing protein [Phytohalomonas tamaricis]|uniref:DUF2076 domain-containing protein n=1 Tax=Phytohalomonas tamaricis TaxID=2081032 RepID=UPI000D0B1095|nr:DUF2076 domain-containing protein [Phytohalomonas tamaricis]